MWWLLLVGCGFLATDPCADRADLQKRLASKVALYSPLTATLRMEENRRFRPVALDVSPAQPAEIFPLVQVDSRGSVFFDGKTAQLGSERWTTMLAKIGRSDKLLVGVDYQVKTAMVQALFDELAKAGIQQLDLVFTVKTQPKPVDPGVPLPAIADAIRHKRARGQWKPVVGGPTTWDQCNGMAAFASVQERPIESAAEPLSKLMLDEYVDCGCQPDSDQVVWEFAAQMPRAYHGVVPVRLAVDQGARLQGDSWVPAFESLASAAGKAPAVVRVGGQR